MKNPYVKIIPDRDVKEVFSPKFIALDSQQLKVVFEDKRFALKDSFDAVLEEGNQLKFLKAELGYFSDNEAIFDIKTSRDVIKREYERVSAILDVVGTDDFSAQTINISAGGMQIRSESELKPECVYDLQIKYDSKDISVKCLVLRSKKHKNKFFISGKFVDLDKDTKAFIMQQNLKNKMFSLKSLPIRQEGGENA